MQLKPQVKIATCQHSGKAKRHLTTVFFYIGIARLFYLHGADYCDIISKTSNFLGGYLWL